MLVRYKGQVSSVKDLPGGGPQGTLLGLLLFLVLINDVGFNNQVNNAGEIITNHKRMNSNTIHLKFIDDLTIAEAVRLNNLEPFPPHKQVLPPNFHARTSEYLPDDLYLKNSQKYQNSYKILVNILSTMK